MMDEFNELKKDLRKAVMAAVSEWEDRNSVAAYYSFEINAMEKVIYNE